MNRNVNRRIVTRRDFLLVVGLPLLFVAAWVLPERFWKLAAVKAAWITGRLTGKRYRTRVEQFARAFGVDAGDPRAQQAAARVSFA